MIGYSLRARESLRIVVSLYQEEHVVLRLAGLGVERTLRKELQVADEALVGQRRVVEDRCVAVGDDGEDVAHELDRDDEAIGALRHGGVHDVQGDEAPLLVAHLNAQVILDDLERAAGEPVLLAVELLDLEEQRVVAGGRPCARGQGRG